MNMKKLVIAGLAALTAVAVFAGCGSQKEAAAPAEKSKIVVGITPGTSDQIMEVVKKEAAKQGLEVEVKSFSDYVAPDQALADGEIDLTSHQHQPFLDAFNEKNGTHLISIGNTYLAPLGLYSRKVKAVAEIGDGAKIGIPNDPSNGGRALLLLEKQGLLKLKDGIEPTKVTKEDIVDNPKHIQIVELDAAQLALSLDDTTASVINAGYAVSGGLNPAQDAIAVEDDTSPYVNIIAARPEDKDNPTYQKFVKIFQSDAVKQYINDNFKGVLVPVW